MPGGMRSDIRASGYMPLVEIVPQTTGVSLSERFSALQSQPPPLVQEVRMVPGPVRNLQMALRMAGQAAEPQRRIPVRQRLGPRPGFPGVRVRNKHLPMLQSGGSIKRKRLKLANGRNYRQHPQLTGVAFHSFKKQPFVPNAAKKTHRPRIIRNGQQQGAQKAGNTIRGVNRFKWRNPDLILNQSGVRLPFRQSKASKEQLDTDLDSYMSKSRGYLTSGIDHFMQ